MTTKERSAALAAEEKLAESLESYAGEWIAIKDESVIASADSMDDLMDRIAPGEVDRIMDVPKNPAEACLL